MASPDDRRYLPSHEWHKLEGDIVTIGISRFAVDELTDITYIEYSNEDGEIAAGDSFGEIESVKATSELYCGVSGTVVQVNHAIIDAPQTVNEDPWGEGWLIKVRIDDPAAMDALLSAPDYDAQLSG